MALCALEALVCLFAKATLALEQGFQVFMANVTLQATFVGPPPLDSSNMSNEQAWIKVMWSFA
eukprot:1160502-Pelagomonas_calceolata.AAC.6